MDLSQRIEKWLLYKGWSQLDVAERLDLSPGTVCMWVGKGLHKHPPNRKNFLRLLAELEISEERFYGRVPRPAPKPRKAAA